MNRPGDGVFAVAFAPDGVTAVTGGDGGSRGRDFLMVWNAAAGKVTRTAAGHEAPVTAVAFAPDGRAFVSGARDNTLRVWDTQGGEPRAVGTSERVAASPVIPPAECWRAPGQTAQSVSGTPTPARCFAR